MADTKPSTWHAWIQLVRMPNVFTVIADVGAAFLLISGSPFPLGRFMLILLSGISLYWAGMILNDVFDIEKDKAERPNRPLASGAIAVQKATRVGWLLLGIGVALAAVSGYIPDSGPDAATVPKTWLPGAIAFALAVLIVAYDGPLKATPFAPAAMGACRFLSFLLGASVMLPIVDGAPQIPRYVLGAALGFGVYVMGITTIARDEALGGHQINLRSGFLLMVIGSVLLAFAPGLSEPADRAAWQVTLGMQFALLVGLIVFPVLIRAFRIQFEPDGKAIGNTIRAGLLTIIPLSAAYALLGAGPAGALAIFALVVPAIVLAMRLRVT